MDARGGARGCWREMAAEELETQYSPSRWVVRLGAEAALRTYTQMGTEGSHPEGAGRGAPPAARALRPGPRETLDIYLPEEASPELPFFLFLHGGFWQSGSKDTSAFMVNPLTARGVAVVVVAYDIAPKGTLDLMVDQVTRSVVFVQQQYPRNKGIYLCGHSAGAHLAAMMLLANWTKHPATPNLKDFFLVSGVYDLEPVLHTSQNAPLLLTLEDARRNSPQLQLGTAREQPPAPGRRTLVIVGQHDSPEFHRQSREFFQALCRGGWDASFEEIPDVDHFEIVEHLTQMDFVLTQIILKTIFPEF